MTPHSVLRPLDGDLWVLDRPLRILGLSISARMTVCRLADGSLWLHSPVEIDPEARAELDALGPVRHVVAPSRVHHFYVASARVAYPDARFYAAPGLAEKRPKLAFDETLGDDPPQAWSEQIDQLLFTGAPYVNEMVFCHRASRTLIFTDLVFNMEDGETLPTRLWLRAMGARGRFGPHRMMRRFVRDRGAARASLDRILAWDFDRIVMSHGRVLQEKGPRVLRDAWRWLDP